MIGNDAGELLVVIQADRAAAADSIREQIGHHTIEEEMVGIGEWDDHPRVIQFTRHRISATPASAGALVEAARALMARWPTDQHEGSPLYDEACALRQALSTTATPASDGVTERMPTGAEIAHVAATIPTPDRFGEGYRATFFAGFDAAAKLLNDSITLGAHNWPEIRENAAILALQPATEGEV